MNRQIPTAITLVFVSLLCSSSVQADEEKAAALVKRFGGSLNREENLVKGSPIVLIFLGKNGLLDGHLVDLADLKELRELDLTNASISDEGMKHLKASTKLQWFSAANTRVGDETMKMISGFKGMKKLFLFGTKVTDAGVKELLKLEHLEHLDIVNANITEKCLDDVIKIKSLKVLHVGSHHFTDDHLLKLTAMTELKTLAVANSIRVTSKGIEKLRKAMPNCKVNQ